MAIMAKSTGSGDFQPCPEGTHIAVCYRVIELGTQKVTWQGHEKEARKVLITWELPDEKMQDGRPFSVSKRYTQSLGDKAALRADLESWRGMKFTKEQLEGFDLSKLLGAAAMLTVIHDTNDAGKTYPHVSTVSKLPKGMKAPPAVNPLLCYSIDEGINENFKLLSENIQATIKKCAEWTRPAQEAEPQQPDADDRPPESDDVPF